VDLPRVKALRASATAANVEVVAYGDLVNFSGKADLVLLDVPCSNTGVLARRVEARYRFDREHLDRLKGMQRQIIADSIRLLRRGSGSCGILYSTCSLDQNENHEQAVWASRWHGLGLAREHVRQPEGLPGDGPERYSDGSYAVLLQ
jgi:16S rRNA (cytosine967-C5)-methyltransferase